MSRSDPSKPSRRVVPRIAMIFAAFLLAGPPLLFVATGIGFLSVTTESGARIGGFLLALFDVTTVIAIYRRFIVLALVLAGVISLWSYALKLTSPWIAGLCGAIFMVLAVVFLGFSSEVNDGAALLRASNVANMALLGFLPCVVCFWIAQRWSYRL